MNTADTVNEWFREHLQCGALARDTEAYNQVVAVLPVLIAQIGPPAADANAVPGKPAKAAKVTDSSAS